MTTGGMRKRRPYAARVPLAARREQLLDAALAIIDRDGYEALSIARIAAEAGVTRPVVYGAYDDLDALSLALLDRTQQRAVDQVVGAFGPLFDGVDIETWARTQLRDLAEIVRADPATWRPILLRLPGMPSEVAERIELTRVGLKAVIADLIRTLGRSSIDPVIGAHLALGALEEIGRQLLAEPMELDLDAAIDSAQVLLRALVAAAPR